MDTHCDITAELPLPSGTGELWIRLDTHFPPARCSSCGFLRPQSNYLRDDGAMTRADTHGTLWRRFGTVCQFCQPEPLEYRKGFRVNDRTLRWRHNDADGLPVGPSFSMPEMGFREMLPEYPRVFRPLTREAVDDDQTADLFGEASTAAPVPVPPPFLRANQAVADGPEAAVRALLSAIGEDPQREGLRDTPRRVVAMLRELCRREPFRFTTFSSEGMDEMVVQSPVGFSSLCEHHMLPFVGTAAVAYIPNGKLVGLSKLARAVRHCSAGLQNQERITTAVADMLERELAPRGVAVVLRARHLCMEVRGVRTDGAFTVTSCMRGAFRDDGKARAEFLKLAGESWR